MPIRNKYISYEQTSYYVQNLLNLVWKRWLKRCGKLFPYRTLQNNYIVQELNWYDSIECEWEITVYRISHQFLYENWSFWQFKAKSLRELEFYTRGNCVLTACMPYWWTLTWPKSRPIWFQTYAHIHLFTFPIWQRNVIKWKVMWERSIQNCI